jgi:hypothetical protein
MSDKLATAPTQPAMAVPVRDDFTSFLERAAKDPTIDVDKLERLLAMKEKQDAQERKRCFFDALAALQAELAPIAKSGTNPHTRSRYVRLDDLLIVLRPLLETHGFAFSFDSKPAAATTIEFTCTLSHRDGHSETKHLTLPTDGVGSQGGKSSMNAIQAVGSTTSYARRYLIDMHLNLARRDEDDDGSGGPKPVTQEQADTLRRTLTEAKGDEKRFLNWAAASTFEEIPAANYARCVTAIQAMQRRGA